MFGKKEKMTNAPWTSIHGAYIEQHCRHVFPPHQLDDVPVHLVRQGTPGEDGVGGQAVDAEGSQKGLCC